MYLATNMGVDYDRKSFISDILVLVVLVLVVQIFQNAYYFLCCILVRVYGWHAPSHGDFCKIDNERNWP